ncbi:MAG: hypothetical protein ABUT39_10470 [Acidobacteriota bacterium]
MARTLTRSQLKARVLRALSGLPQEEFERETQVENIAGIESGSRRLGADQVARMCPSAGLTPEGCEALIREYEALAVHGAETSHPPPSRRERWTNPEHAAGIAAIIEAAETRIGRIGEERSAMRAAEREQARGSWERAQGLSFDDVALLARASREYQSWALVERVCDESLISLIPGEQGLAELAVEIAGRVRGSEGWCRRIRGFALAHLAKARRAAGDPGAARETLAEAERLWKSGEDPDQVLDAGRFRSLKASATAR